MSDLGSEVIEMYLLSGLRRELLGGQSQTMTADKKLDNTNTTHAIRNRSLTGLDIYV